MLPLLNLMFLHNALAVFFIGTLINYVERYMPTFIVRSFRYGKFAHTGQNSLAKAIEVPKSYFKHFYAVAIALFTITLLFVYKVYFSSLSVPSWFISFLDFLCGSDREVTSTAGGTLIVITLLSIQCYRRFYETFRIQVFAKNGKISIFQYIVGHSHYTGCIIAILGHAPGFTKHPQENFSETAIFSYVTLIMAVPLTTLFTIAWLNQFWSNLILSNLRRDKKSNKVITDKHFIPKGGLFKYISCPHQLCEVIMYITLAPLLGMNSAWFCVVLWVLINQVETSLLSHWWYEKRFPNYPKNRKAILPYVL